jgi:hypothetical protein
LLKDMVIRMKDNLNIEWKLQFIIITI